MRTRAVLLLLLLLLQGALGGLELEHPVAGGWGAADLGLDAVPEPVRDGATLVVRLPASYCAASSGSAALHVAADADGDWTAALNGTAITVRRSGGAKLPAGAPLRLHFGAGISAPLAPEASQSGAVTVTFADGGSVMTLDSPEIAADVRTWEGGVWSDGASWVDVFGRHQAPSAASELAIAALPAALAPEGAEVAGVVVSNAGELLVPERASLAIGAPDACPVSSRPVIDLRAATYHVLVPGQAIDDPPLSVFVNDSDTSVDQLELTAESSNASVLLVSAPQGEGHDRSLSVTAAGSLGLADVTLRVSDGSKYSEAQFRVRVAAPNVTAVWLEGADEARVQLGSPIELVLVVDHPVIAYTPVELVAEAGCELSAAGLLLAQWHSHSAPFSMTCDHAGHAELAITVRYASHFAVTVPFGGHGAVGVALASGDPAVSFPANVSTQLAVSLSLPSVDATSLQISAVGGGCVPSPSVIEIADGLAESLDAFVLCSDVVEAGVELRVDVLDSRHNLTAFVATGVSVVSGAGLDLTDPPQMLAAVQLDTTDAVEVTFDRPCYCGGAPCEAEELDCADLFLDLGLDLACWFADNATLRLSPSPSPDQVDALQLRGGFVAGSPESELFATGSATLQARTPAAELASAQFDDSGASLRVAFEGQVYRPAGDEDVPCSELFQHSDVHLGYEAVCRWADDGQELHVELGQNDTIVPGDCEALTLVEGAAPPVEGSVVWASGCVVALAPSDPVAPVVQLDGVASLSRCADLDLAATTLSGSGGRALAYRWFLSNSTWASETATSEDLHVPGRLLEADTDYVVAVQASNFLGATSANASVVVRRNSFVLPALRVSGPREWTVKRSGTAAPAVAAFVRACDGELLESAAVDFSWPDEYAAYVTADPRKLLLPAYSLAHGTHRITAMAAMRGNALANSTVDVLVTVVSSSLEARIAGGSSRVVSGPFELDATVSVDPDGLDEEFSYAWSCAAGGDDGVLALDPADFAGQGALSCTVSVSKGSPGAASPHHLRVANASTTVVFASAAVAEVSVAVDGDDGAAKVNPSARAVVRATVGGAVDVAEAAWTVEDGDLSAADFATPLTSATLVVRPGVLAVGREYTLRYSARAVGATELGYADIVLSVNAPPAGGFVEVFPTSGEPLLTTFELSSGGWTDDAEDLPLAYTFAVVAASTGRTTTLTAVASFESALSTVLPAGSLTVRATARDVLGAQAATSSGPAGAAAEVSVVPTAAAAVAATDLAAVVNVTSSLLLQYADEQAGEGMLSSVAAALSVVDCEAVCASADAGTQETRQGLVELALGAVRDASGLVSDAAQGMSQQLDAMLAVAPCSCDLASVEDSLSQMSALADAADSMTSEQGAAALEVLSSLLLPAVSDTTASLIDSVVTSMLVDTVAYEDPVVVVADSFSVTAQRQTNGEASGLALADGASLALPPTLSFSRRLLSEAGSEVNVQATQWGQSPHADGSRALHANVTSVNVVQLDASGNAVASALRPDTPVTLTMAVPVEAADEAECGYWDDAAADWQTLGMVSAGVTAKGAPPGFVLVSCETMHLTDFSSTASKFSPEMNAVDPVGDASELEAYASLTNLSALVIVGGFYAFFGLHTAVLGYRDGALKAMRSRMLRQMYLDRGQVSAPPMLMRTASVKELTVAYSNRLREHHDWIAMYYPHDASSITMPRAERCLLLLCACQVTLAVTALFFGKDNDAAEQKVTIALIGMLCILPTTMVFPKLFAAMNAPPSSSTTATAAPSKKRRLRERWARMRARGKVYLSSPAPSSTDETATAVTQLARVEEAEIQKEQEQEQERQQERKVALGPPLAQVDSVQPYLVQGQSNTWVGPQTKHGHRPAKAPLKSELAEARRVNLLRQAADAGRGRAAAVEEPTTTAKATTALGPPMDFVQRTIAQRPSVVLLPPFVPRPYKPPFALGGQAGLRSVIIMGFTCWLLGAFGMAGGGLYMALQFPFVMNVLAVSAGFGALLLLLGMLGVQALTKDTSAQLQRVTYALLFVPLLLGPPVLGLCRSFISASPSGARDLLRGDWEAKYASSSDVLRAWQTEHDCCGYDDQADMSLDCPAVWDKAGCGASVEAAFFKEGEGLMTCAAMLLVLVVLIVPACLSLLLKEKRVEPVAQPSRYNEHVELSASLAMRLQAAFRGFQSRKRATRQRELLAWEAMTQERKVMKTACICMVVLITLFATYLNLIFGVKLNAAENWAWLSSSVVSLLLDIFVQQPAKILFMAIFGGVLEAIGDALLILFPPLSYC